MFKNKLHALRAVIFLVVILIEFSLLVPSLAQATNDVNINYTQVTDQPDQRGIDLKLFFTVLDSAHKPILTPQIKSAVFQLDPKDGGNVPVKVSQATGPISLVLVLDTSGSMNLSMKTMQQAASQIVSSSADGSNIAVIQFSSSVNVVQDFTTNKSSAITAINNTKAGGNTCLYDAILKGVDILSKAVPGRRAVLVFTDGKDETAAGKQCSKSSPDDIIRLATARTSQTPIYSIGFGNAQDVAQDVLRNISNSTTGTFAFGKDINALFQEIQDAINAQQVAEALIHPAKGDRNVVLELTGNDANTKINPAVTSFTSPADYSIPPTATPTQTFQPPSITVNSVRVDEANQQFLIDVIANNQALVKEYHVDFVSANGTLQQEIIAPAPITAAIPIPMSSLPGGEYSIRLIAIAQNGTTVLGQSTDFKFKFQPTATPTFTATSSPQPISATIQSIAYDDQDTKKNIIVTLSILGKDQISRLSASITNSSTKLTLATYDPLPVDSTVKLSLQDIPSGDYDINIYFYGTNGQQLGINTRSFKHTLQPTATPTLAPTATQLIISANLGVPQMDPDGKKLIINVQTTNENLIASYKVLVVNDSTNLVQKEYTFRVPPYNPITIPLSDLDKGKFTVKVQPQDTDGKSIGQGSQTQFEIIPPTPTNTPTATVTPTPEPTGLIPALSKGISDPGTRPFVIGGFGVILLLLLGTIVVLSRRPKKRSTRGRSGSTTSTGKPLVLSEMTGVINLGPPPTATPTQEPAQSTNQITLPPPTRKQQPTSEPNFDLTNPVILPPLPKATLNIESTVDEKLVGKMVTINKVPFTMGRNNRDISFDNDKNVSRDHAEIIFQGSGFFLVDKGSTHKTFVNGTQLVPNEPSMLESGDEINLGPTTILRFTSATPGGNDAVDRTQPLKR